MPIRNWTTFDIASQSYMVCQRPLWDIAQRSLWDVASQSCTYLLCVCKRLMYILWFFNWKKPENFGKPNTIPIGLDLSIHTLYYYLVGAMHYSFVKTVKLLLGIIVRFLSVPPACGCGRCPLLGRYILVLLYGFPCGTHHIRVLQRNKCIIWCQVSHTFARVIFLILSSSL